MQQRDHLIGTSRLVVRVATMLNRLFLAAVCLGMLLSFLFAGSFASWLIQPGARTDVAATLIRCGCSK